MVEGQSRRNQRRDSEKLNRVYELTAGHDCVEWVVGGSGEGVVGGSRTGKGVTGSVKQTCLDVVIDSYISGVQRRTAKQGLAV